LRPEAARRQASTLEVETRIFYEKAASRTQDASIRQLLNDLAQEEREHEHRAEELGRDKLDAGTRGVEDEASRRLFVLQIVQPGLAGLMDGSVSTLAPVFAAAFARHESHFAFLVGLAASLGAGISMGFAEALSDDGSLTGRGHPGCVGWYAFNDDAGRDRPHASFLIPAFRIATVVAVVVVIAELGAIAWVRHRYMETPWVSATLQVGAGRNTGFCSRRADWEFVDLGSAVRVKQRDPEGRERAQAFFIVRVGLRDLVFIFKLKRAKSDETTVTRADPRPAVFFHFDAQPALQAGTQRRRDFAKLNSILPALVRPRNAPRRSTGASVLLPGIGKTSATGEPDFNGFSV